MTSGTKSIEKCGQSHPELLLRQTESSPNPGPEFSWLARLGNVVMSTLSKSFFEFGNVSLSCLNDHRNIFGFDR